MEWHAGMDCLVNESECRESILLTHVHIFVQDTSPVKKLALIVARIRYDSRVVDAFAHFSLEVQTNRSRWFRRVSSYASKGELAEAIVCSDG